MPKWMLAAIVVLIGLLLGVAAVLRHEAASAPPAPSPAAGLQKIRYQLGQWTPGCASKKDAIRGAVSDAATSLKAYDKTDPQIGKEAGLTYAAMVQLQNCIGDDSADNTRAAEQYLQGAQHAYPDDSVISKALDQLHSAPDASASDQASPADAPDDGPKDALPARGTKARKQAPDGETPPADSSVAKAPPPISPELEERYLRMQGKAKHYDTLAEDMRARLAGQRLALRPETGTNLETVHSLLDLIGRDLEKGDEQAATEKLGRVDALFARLAKDLGQ